MKDERVPRHERSLQVDDIAHSDDADFGRYQSLRLTVAALSAMEVLNVQWEPISEVQVAMRQKLVVNAVINPLSAIMGCRNGEIFKQHSSGKIVHTICSEASYAFTKEMNASTLAMLESVGDKDNERQMPLGRLPRVLQCSFLQAECQRVAENTRGNISSMLTDIRKGKPTEIDYINGYLVRLGNVYGIPMRGNSMLLNLVKMRSAIPLDQML